MDAIAHKQAIDDTQHPLSRFENYSTDYAAFGAARYVAMRNTGPSVTRWWCVIGDLSGALRFATLNSAATLPDGIKAV